MLYLNNLRHFCTRWMLDLHWSDEGDGDLICIRTGPGFSFIKTIHVCCTLPGHIVLYIIKMFICTRKMQFSSSLLAPRIFCVNHKVCGVVPFLNKCLHHNCWFSSNNKVVSKISWWVTNEATHEKRLPWIFAFGHCRCGVCIVFSSSLPTFAVKEPSNRRGENTETETPSGKSENSKAAL